MKTSNLYLKYSDKHLDLLSSFMNYLSIHKRDFDLPSNASLVFFDTTDKKFSDYSLRILKKLSNKDEQDNIVEVTHTGSGTIPWRVSKPVDSKGHLLI